MLVVGLVVSSAGCSSTDANAKEVKIQYLWVFTSESCGPCKRDKPALKKIIESGKYDRCYVVDVDEYPQIKEYWGVRRWPTYIVCGSELNEIFRTGDVKDL